MADGPSPTPSENCQAGGNVSAMEVQVAPAHYIKEKYLSLHRFISYFYQIDAVRLAKGNTILLIGVGDNVIPDLLRKFPNYTVTTVDIDEALVPDIVADVRKLPFPDASFDVVCAFEILEHLPFEETEKAIKEIARVAKRTVLVSVPHRRSGFELVFRFPYARSVLKNSYARITALFPVRFPGFIVSTQHHWEIDGRCMTLKRFRNALTPYFVIEKEETPVLDSYLRFFTLCKKT